MSCKHPEIVLTPGTIIPEGDGFVIGDLDGGTMYCPKCESDLPIEDLHFYKEEQISIAIPADMVDTPNVSEPLE